MQTDFAYPFKKTFNFLKHSQARAPQKKIVFNTRPSFTEKRKRKRKMM
jgi:hypothetical protein